MYIDYLLNLIESETKLDNYDEVRGELIQAIDDKHFLPLTKGKEMIGFMTWWEIKGEETRVFINNLFIKREHRNRNNLLFLRKLFKQQLYPLVGKYWESKKKGKVYETA